MGFGDVLAGWAQAAHEHHTNLLQMEYENRLKAADIYSKFADTPGLAPEQASFLRQGALAHLNFPEKVPAQYKFDPEKPEVKIPVAVPQPAPPPVKVPGSEGAPPSQGTLPTPATQQGMNLPIPGSPTPPPSPDQQGAPGAPQGYAMAAINPQQVQPPTPPPQTVMRSPFEVPSASEQVLRQQPIHEEAVRTAGAQAGAVSEAQDPARLRDIQARMFASKLKNESDLAKINFRPKYDLNGEQLGIEKIPDDELPGVQQSVIAKNKAAADASKAKDVLDRAEAEWNKSRTDPKSPVNQLMLGKLDLARANYAVSQTRLGLMEESQLARYFGRDKDGNALPGAPRDPETGQPVGQAFARFYGPTAAMLTRRDLGRSVISQGNAMITFAADPANEHVFGKEGGLQKWAADKIGTNDPALAGIGAMIDSMSSFLTGMHQARGAALAANFKQTMRNVDSPEAFTRAVHEYIMAAERLEADKQGAAAPPSPPPSGGGMVSVQLGDGRKGQIPEAQVPQFLKDNKGSKRLSEQSK